MEANAAHSSSPPVMREISLSPVRRRPRAPTQAGTGGRRIGLPTSSKVQVNGPASKARQGSAANGFGLSQRAGSYAESSGSRSGLDATPRPNGKGKARMVDSPDPLILGPKKDMSAFNKVQARLKGEAQRAPLVPKMNGRRARRVVVSSEESLGESSEDELDLLSSLNGEASPQKRKARKSAERERVVGKQVASKQAASKSGPSKTAAGAAAARATEGKAAASKAAKDTTTADKSKAPIRKPAAKMPYDYSPPDELRIASSPNAKATPTKDTTPIAKPLWKIGRIRKKADGPRTEEELADNDIFFAEQSQEKQRDEESRKLVHAADDFFSAEASSDVRAERHQIKLANRVAKLADSQTGRRAAQAAEMDADDVYCAAFCDLNNLCDYCHEPLPKLFSDDLTKLQSGIKDASNWRQTISFCTAHRAETRTIPLGERDGFPAVIDFDAVDRRLEAGFIRDRLGRVAAKPHLSKFFRRALREIELMGMAKWKALDNQATESALSLATPGYYGDLGRAIIIQHFQLLAKWGFMRSLSSPAIRPLSATDFIATVLVPEAAVLLIMDDQGWRGDCKGEGWDVARREAMDIRHRSGDYGRWRFREDSGLGAQVLARLKRQEEGKRRRLEAWAREQDAQGNGHLRGTDDDPWVVSSDAPDSSELEDEEGFWPDAIQAAEEVERGGAGRALPHITKHYRFDEDEDATPRGKRMSAVDPTPRGRPTSTLSRHNHSLPSSQSSTSSGGWDVSMGGEALAALDEIMLAHSRSRH